MVTREQDEFRENLRHSFEDNLFTRARLMNSDTLLHVVDEDALTKCRLSTYGQMRGLNKHMIHRTEDYADMEKARDARGVSASKLENRIDCREIGLDQNLEEIYFNYYGHGSNDSPVPDRPGGSYKCECGTRFMMGWKGMPTECPRCHRLTPVGEMKRDGILKRI